MENTKKTKSQKRLLFFKILAGIFGYALCIFGFLCFSSSAATNINSVESTFYKAQPINMCAGLVVDTNGNIYIGSGDTNSILVFNRNGQFQYGFSFPSSGGSFAFGLDSSDTIHVVVYRTDTYYEYRHGAKILRETTTHVQQIDLAEQYHMHENSSAYTRNDTMYELSGRRTLVITRISTGEKQKVILDTPFWPLSTLQGWLISAVGMGLVFWSFAWKLCMQGKANRHNSFSQKYHLPDDI